ncbi:uncharacterized protein LOC124445637 isoform X1 [Xenia sp. Carnegie-2017]|uniref:uncharacterized protein LOC124445637 isoform X1 n=1 Tax=Xenia sp. Carnegie-2017 TaxID=2897299 RepID=UPI001F0353B2|nr:uncharacterized protein LOC124445637 isoform X1 [Xenia sp. Carnegie-2017]
MVKQAMVEINLIYFLMCYAFFHVNANLLEECGDTATTKNLINVSPYGQNIPNCLSNGNVSCKSLDYVFEMKTDLTSTKVFIADGHYKLAKNYTFSDVKYLALIGWAPGQVVIECAPNAGLSFVHSSKIVIGNLIFRSCGSTQNSTSTADHNTHLKFSTALFFVNCIDLCMLKVVIELSPGIAVQLYDVSGAVIVSECYFYKNGNNVSVVENNPGGGFYIEFTVKGGLYPFKKPPDELYQSNGTFHFNNVTFERNNATLVNVPVTPGGTRHIAFGRGGGASIFIKGQAKNNSFLFENCSFIGNGANWGAGLFVEYQDETQMNLIIFQSCHFHSNIANLAGGGLRVGLVAMKTNRTFVPNSIQFRHCSFKMNKAILGGGISLYATTKQSYLVFRAKSYVCLTHCVFQRNQATVGASIFVSIWNTGFHGKIKLSMENSLVESNEIIYTEDKKVTGLGSVYLLGIPLILNDTHFKMNKKTALVIADASVEVHGNVSFIGNIGERGGAISMYGISTIVMKCGADLSFINNSCTLQGGAIYVKTPGPQMVAFNTTELALYGCFFKRPPCKNYSVTFYGNKGEFESSGHSVYATTLQFCRGDNEPRINNQALEWELFNYYDANGTKSNMMYEIVTDAVSMKLIKNDWKILADKYFSPQVNLADEKSNSVFGVVKVMATPKDKVNVTPSSTYFLAKKEIKSLKVEASPKTNYDVEVKTVDSQLISDKVSGAVVNGCESGFIWNGHVCKCNDIISGISRCDNENKRIFLFKGFWARYIKSSGAFYVVRCPEKYCLCNKNSSNEQTDPVVLTRALDNFDKFLQFVIHLADFQIVGIGVCLWSSLDDLQKLSLQYVIPFYFVICLFVLNKIVVKWPSNSFSRRFTRVSMARAFCTLLVLSYSAIVNASLKILLPVKIGDKFFVFYQGEEKYFGKYHIYFAIIALLFLIFVGLLFPLCLIHRHWFSCIDRGLCRLLLDNFQRCYRPGHKWFAGFYFVCRLILNIIAIAVQNRALQIALFNVSCSVMLAVVVYCRPYANGDTNIVPYRILNLSDALVLCNLCVVTSFSGASLSMDARSYYEGFGVLIYILSYLPLCFAFGLLVFALVRKCRIYNGVLRNVNE